ncbi:MAG TPA: ATP-binding protein [Blastocatellia bacterium]|nr:ATP-binding protein [Blastocatellia bacterium]
MADDDEEKLLRSVALQNAQAILIARQRAEQEIIRAKEALEQKTEELASAKELLQNVFDHAAVGIARIDAAGRLLMVNPRLCEMLGYTSEELIAVGLLQLTHADDLAADFEMTSRLLSGETPVYRREKRYLRKDGAVVWVHLTISVERETAGASDRSFIAVIQDITERKKAEAEREQLLMQEKRAREVAEHAARAKDEFLAVVSHELRSPLSAIIGYARMARSNPHDAAQVSRYCKIIERSAKTQQQLIEDLLDTARIITGQLKLNAAPTDLLLVLEEALDVVRPAASAKQIDLVARLGAEPQQIIGDAARLQQVVGNLLQNAIKFTPEGGRVELRLERGAGQVRIIVSDSGIGIEPEFLPAVFDRFSQQDASRTRRYSGLGLGLSLVKQLVELHGGLIEVASAGVGRGATFTVRLPLRAPQIESRPPPARAITEIHANSGAMPLEDLPRLDGVRVLLVDDEEDARLMIADTLGDCGATVTAVASGRQAREIMADEPFDALVCDIAMPDEDGYEVIGRIRALENQRGLSMSQRLPAIALTALARPEDRMQALEAGFQMHVAKPVEPAELVVVIKSLIRQF